MSNSQIIRGIPAAPGMAIGPAVIIGRQDPRIPRTTGKDLESELLRLSEAREKASRELTILQEKVASTIKTGEADVFFAQRMFVDDINLQEAVKQLLLNGLNVEAAWMDAIESFAVRLEALPDPTLSARSVDLRDVGQRVLFHLLGLNQECVRLDNPSVIIADDLSPSQTAGLLKEKVLAYCTEKGGPTSHTAILAKALGLPAVVALGQQLRSIETGTIVLVNGNNGEITVNPDDQVRRALQKRSDQMILRRDKALDEASNAAVTLDGIRVEVVANIGGLEDARAALAYGAEGVGLFRTEFLYLDRQDLPSEAEQIELYRKVFDRMEGFPVVVRTLDIGGDKTVPYLGFQEEANPFLGWRAIRMNEGRPDIFKSQVRALLQAATNKDLRIMIPMVSNIEEIRLARHLIDSTREELTKDGLPAVQEYQFGIMVEIPSAALLAHQLAPIVDFFSIGTNDLTQYTLAVDRTNAQVAHLASPYHPAVLRLVQMTIQAGRTYGKWVGMCGELAGEVTAVPLLLGLGLHEFSATPTLVPYIKQAIRKCVQADCKLIAEKALRLSSTSEVITLLTDEAEKLDLF